MHAPTSPALLALGVAVLAVLGAQLSAASRLLAAVGGLRVDVGALGARLDDHGRQLGALGARLDDHGRLLDDHGRQLGALAAAIVTLAEAAVTPAVGARLEECGRSSVVSAFVFLESGLAHQQCSAVPLPGTVDGRRAQNASSSSYFLTSAHCFMEDGNLVASRVALSYRRVMYACSLHSSFAATPPVDDLAEPSLDLAILHCSNGGVPISPTNLASTPYAAHVPAAVIGFTRGEHHDHDMTAGWPEELGNNRTYALHTKVSRLSSSFQTPDMRNLTVAGGIIGVSGVVTEGGLPTSPASFPSSKSSVGFIDLSPFSGMSGGGVFGSYCGLFGITRQRSVFGTGGEFVRLIPSVLARISRAVLANTSVAA